MTQDQFLKRLKPLCTEIPDEVLQDFLSRMDREYFARFDLEDIRRHIHLASRLDPDQPCQAVISRKEDGTYNLVIVAYDYFSEFATICGLLSAFGLDIREGSIYTFTQAEAVPPPPRTQPFGRRARGPGRAGLTRKKIVDCFVVRPLPGTTWPKLDQERFTNELTLLIRLLDDHRFQDARRRVNRRLVEVLARTRGGFSGLLNPVHIRFDNQQSLYDTVMSIRSADTPAFLYAFSNALAMRGVYIHKARFEHLGTELHDEFYIRDRHGKKITDADVLHELRITAVLMKQFTQFLRGAPDPAKAIEHFDQFLDVILKEAGQATGKKALAFLTKRNSLDLLARLLGTSDFLWEDFLRKQHVHLLPFLESYQRLPLIRPRSALIKGLRSELARARSDEQRQRRLNAFKDQELFRIDMKHLAEPSTSLGEFSQALTELAEVVLDHTVHACSQTLSQQCGPPKLANRKPCPFTVLGMGKFGGRELGYASDIEVLFVYGGPGSTSGRRPLDNSEYFERLAQEILKWIEAKQEGIFHIDVRLRPHGNKGQLANTLEELGRYYSPSGFSAPFERQALIKLRWVAGERTLGHEVERLRDRVVYSKAPWDLEEALELRRTQIRELVAPGQTNIKYSHGGLIDIEYAVQYLQLLHGHRHPELRTPNTLEAIEALGILEILPKKDVTALREAYVTFRLVIDGLRIVRGNAKDLVLPPTDSEAFVFLARRVGYSAEDWRVGAQNLGQDLAEHMARVSEFSRRHFAGA